MHTNFKLSIGMDADTAAPDSSNYTTIAFDFELHKQKVTQAQT